MKLLLLLHQGLGLGLFKLRLALMLLGLAHEVDELLLYYGRARRLGLHPGMRSDLLQARAGFRVVG